MLSRLVMAVGAVPYVVWFALERRDPGMRRLTHEIDVLLGAGPMSSGRWGRLKVQDGPSSDPARGGDPWPSSSTR